MQSFQSAMRRCASKESEWPLGASNVDMCVCGAALIEALMGFQFNHVGGGTKTRRPITLHMKYNAGCVQPACILVTEDFGDQEVTLEELQVRLEPSFLAQCHGCRFARVAAGHQSHLSKSLQLSDCVQEYIENENSRLEREHQFWAKEIIVKIEYKYCPNLTIIDTPGDSLPSQPAHSEAHCPASAETTARLQLCF